MDITPLFIVASGSCGSSGGGGGATCELKPYSYEGVSAKTYVNAVNIDSEDYQLVIDGSAVFGEDKVVCAFQLIVDNQSQENSAYLRIDLVQGENIETIDEVEIPKGAIGIPMSFDIIAKLKIYGKGKLRITMLGYYIENEQKVAEPID